MTKGRGFSCLASTLAPFLLLEGRGFPGERGRVWLCWSLPPSVPPSEASLLFSGEPLTPASEAAPLLVRCCCLFSSWLIYHACFGKHGYIHTQQQRCQNSHLLSLAGFSLEGWYSWRASACLPTGLWSQELWPRALCRAVSWTLGSPPAGIRLWGAPLSLGGRWPQLSCLQEPELESDPPNPGEDISPLKPIVEALHQTFSSVP